MKTKLFLICLTLTVASCIPNVTYHGRFGDYKATPNGLVIQPKYSK